MSNQWTDNLRKRMEAHRESPPEGLWEDIERSMKREKFFKNFPAQQPVLLWGKRIGAAAAIVLAVLLIGSNFLDKKAPRETQITIQSKQAPSKTDNKLSSYPSNEKIFTAENINKKGLSHDKKYVALPASKKCSGTEEQKNFVVNAREKETPEIGSQQENSPNGSDLETKASNNHPVSKVRNFNEYDLGTAMPIIKQKTNSFAWTTSVYASNISLNSTKTYDGYKSFVAGEIPPETDGGEETAQEGDPIEDIFVKNKYKEVYTDIKHRQPVVIGISAGYNLDERWSITGGFIYTRLLSTLRAGSSSNYYTTEQTLHNIGVPININYNIWKSKKASIYLSGGGLVEKNISGNLTTDYIVDNKFKSSKKDKISEDRLQWSLNAAAGIQYNLFSKIGLYAEPGASYYFNNGSEVETIYKARPLNLSLRFGLRFSFGK